MGLNLGAKSLAVVTDPESKKKIKPLLVAWSPAQAELPAFTHHTHEGRFFADLLGRDVHSVFQTAHLFDEPTPAANEDWTTLMPEARQSAVRLMQEHPYASLILSGWDTCHAFGVDRNVRKQGFLSFFNTGNRVVAAVPSYDSFKFWGNPSKAEAGKLFFRSLSGKGPLTENFQYGDGFTSRVDIDLEELERIARLHPSIPEAAAAFGMSVRTFERRLSEPEYREAWEAGKSDTSFKLRKKQLEVAEKGNVKMLVWLGEHLLGQKREEPFSIQVGEGSARITFTRSELEQELQTLDAEFQIAQATDIEDAQVIQIGAGEDDDGSVSDPG